MRCGELLRLRFAVLWGGRCRSDLAAPVLCPLEAAEYIGGRRGFTQIFAIGPLPLRSSISHSARVSYSAALQKQDRIKTYAGAYLGDHGFVTVMVDARQQLILTLLSQHHPANSEGGVRRRSALREGPGGGSSVRALSRAAEFAKIARVLDDILRRAGRR